MTTFWIQLSIDEAQALWHAAGAGGLAGDHYDRLSLFDDDLDKIDLAVRAFEKLEFAWRTAEAKEQHERQKQRHTGGSPAVVRKDRVQGGKSSHPKEDSDQSTKPDIG